MQRVVQRASPILVLALFGAALFALEHELRHYRLQDIRSAIESIPSSRLLVALLVTVLSYSLLTLYDWLALKYAGRKLDYGRVAFASFSAYVFSYNIGFSVLGGAAVRYRLYSGWGLSALDITRVVLFTSSTFWLGLLSTMGGLFAAGAASERVGLPLGVERALGAVLLGLILAYLAGCAYIRRPVRLRQVEFNLPGLPLALAQLGLAVVDLLLAGLVLYALFPGKDVSLPVFLGVYLTAMVVGLISHVPGGLGVFETMVVLLLPTATPHPDLIAMLLAFRAIYYLIPFLVGLVLVGGHTALQQRRHLAGISKALSKGVTVVTPRVLTFAVFFSGIVLLVSGNTPASSPRLAWLGTVLPLGVLEVSHFIASLCGAALLFLARGLQLRLNAAWGLTLILLVAGAVFSLVKGLDYEEAMLLSVAAAALAVSHRHFHRKSPLWDRRFSPGWLVAIGLVLMGATWIGFFTYKHIEYSSELWWRFEVAGNAPRFLRASVGIAILVAVIGLSRLLRVSRTRPHPTADEDLETAMAIAGQSPTTAANLVALGDKSILFSETRRSFIMYATSGRSLVAMGDPVGPTDEAEELVWRFREACDAVSASPVFYEVSANRLPLYVDLGLSLFKLGEEARVRLETFALEGGHRKGLRRTLSKVEADGCRFAFWSAEEVKVHLPELEAVSDAWLVHKRTREKRFSLGSFSPGYVARFSAGIVLRQNQVVAFATIWRGGDQEELSVDLMRYSTDAPPSTMEYLFLKLIILGKELGYRWFNIGMAPFSGIEQHPLAPLWSRFGALLFRHGEDFYSFQGLRQYKGKFDPVWEPKYLACPGGLALPRVLADVGALVSGGLSGLIRR